MKFRLKKDLPFAKAGTPVVYSDLNIGGQWIVNRRFVGHSISILIEEGWIEEIKPREWWIGILENGEIYVQNDKGDLDMQGEIIKVREIIDEQKD